MWQGEWGRAAEGSSSQLALGLGTQVQGPQALEQREPEAGLWQERAGAGPMSQPHALGGSFLGSQGSPKFFPTYTPPKARAMVVQTQWWG